MKDKLTWQFTFCTLSEVYYKTFLDEKRKFFMNHNKDKIKCIKGGLKDEKN